MKRKSSYTKITIQSIYQLNELNEKNNLIPINELEISIPGPGIYVDLEKIPKSVSVLKFNYNYRNLPCEIPLNINSVYFYEFYYPIEELPNTIEHIQIHKGFNHPVDKLGDHLKSIDFGWNFNQPVDDLPSSLEKVVFYSSFTYPINNLPSNIKFIHIFNPKYNLESIKTLPKSLILLQLGMDNNLHNDFNFTFDLKGKNYVSLNTDTNYDSQKQVYLKNIYFYKN